MNSITFISLPQKNILRATEGDKGCCNGWAREHWKWFFACATTLTSILLHSYTFNFLTRPHCVCSLFFIYIVLSLFSRARGFVLQKGSFFCLISQLNVTIRNHWASNQFISHTVFNIIITAWCWCYFFTVHIAIVIVK